MEFAKLSDNNNNELARSRETMINGQRPSPLRINKYSRTIHKTSSSSSSSSSISSVSRDPVIIYTHSPKVIHTKPRDFKALVQKLTGLSRSEDDDQTAPSSIHENDLFQSDYDLKSPRPNNKNQDENQTTTSSVLTFDDINHRRLSEIPLFTPNTADFFWSPKYRIQDGLFGIGSPNLRNSGTSVSVSELRKGVQDY